MLSKLIYRFVAIAMFALVAQVGYSQNYVDVDQAMVLLEHAITDLESELETTPAYTGQFHALVDQSAEKMELQLMKTVKSEISSMKDVKEVMDTWYDTADQQPAERKTKLILALDKVKDLLS